MLAIVLAGLMAAMAPSAFANPSDVTLDVSLVDAPEKGWYASGEVVSLSGIITNVGDATAIDVDPSCNEVLRVWSEDVLVYDGADICLGQSRGMDIGANSETPVPVLNWDLTNNDGEFVSPGDYIVEYFIAGEELSSTVNVHVQTPVTIPDELEISAVVSARDGVHSESAPSILTIRLQNNHQDGFDLNFQECALVINDELHGECGPDSIKGFEALTIAQIPVEIQSGQNSFNISLGDNSLTEELTIVGETSENTGETIPEQSQLEVLLETGEQYEFGNSDIFSSEIRILNDGNEDISVEFTDSCFGEIWIVDSSGEVVMDSRALKECTEFEADYQILPGEHRAFSQPEWNFVDTNGCHVAPGDYTVIFEIPELHLYSTTQIVYTGESGNYCVDDEAYISSELMFSDALQINPIIHNEANNQIAFFTSCRLFTTLVVDGETINDWGSHCENNEPYSTNSQEIELGEQNLSIFDLEDGEYSLIFETQSAPKVRSVISFVWPIVNDDSEDTEQSNEENPEVIDSWIITGSWAAVTNELGTCWLLNTPDDEILTLSGAQGLASWTPVVGENGEYLVHDSEPATECSDFAAKSFVVKEVYSQSAIVEEDEEEIVVVAEPPLEDTGEQIDPAVITVGVAVASTGILSLLIAGIATNESWRIPATSAGLWLLGLVGRTSETSDGRYQRGRLMGYLTANPGCHFRALMAALDMSNGQITHHLKILQDEGRIWRRPDGRLVRFYPYTSNLHPGVLDENLPMPPLSPDPNSLQGKILRLLDDDGQMNKFPTQAELARRLDRSQQLVSHHLRTLQKYGLVQKQKSGVKNRYGLTREALFLLETTEL